MHRQPLRLAVTALALGLAACGDLSHQNPFDPATPPGQQARAALEGAVDLEATGAAAPSLAGVVVSITGTSLSAVTDAAGRYRLDGVAPGTWTVQATHPGYRVALLGGLAVTLDDGGKAVPVPDLFLQAARGDLLGRVALSLEVGGLREDSAAGVAVTLDTRDGAVFSDAAGTYHFTGVPVGQYLVVASKTGFKGATSLGMATVVDGLVTTFDELLELPPDPGGIGGSVLVLGAADSFGVTVRAHGATLSGTPVELTTTSAADGAFLLSPIPAGTYNVTFEKAD